MRISDWSSDVCSSDLSLPIRGTPDDVPQPRILSFIARVTSWRRLVEKRVEIGACRSCQGIAFLTAQIGEKRQRVGDEGGLAGLAAVRDGGEEGRVDRKSTRLNSSH